MAELKRKYNDLRLLQKRANQAMVRLERLGIKSPAYMAVQAKLEMIGRQKSDRIGRRFSESGIATYNEYEHQKKILEDFLGSKTRTQKGAKQWVEDVWQGALDSKKKLELRDSGITKDQWLDFWQEMPARQKDRLLGSEVIVKLVRTYTSKNKELRDDQKLSMQEIADAITESQNVKQAYKKLGLSYEDTKKPLARSSK